MLMNVQVMKLMNVIPTPCVLTLKGRMCVVVKVDILGMEKTVQVNKSSQFSRVTTCSCYVFLFQEGKQKTTLVSPTCFLIEISWEVWRCPLFMFLLLINVNWNLRHFTPVLCLLYELWTNVQALKQTSVTPMLCVLTMKDPMYVVV